MKTARNCRSPSKKLNTPQYARSRYHTQFAKMSSGKKVRSQLMFSTTSAVFDLLAGDRLSGSRRKAWQLKDAREWNRVLLLL